jgi:glycosyltransferase involved in cell wall biosynthesis
MRLLYLNPCARMGGAETSLYELLASIRESRPDWPMHLWLGEDGPFVRKVRSLGVQVTVEELPEALASLGDAGLGGIRGKILLAGRLAASAPAVIAYRRRMRRFITAWQPDIVHTTGFKMHLLGAMTCPERSSLVWHMHDYLRGRPAMQKLLRTQMNNCRALLTNSASVAIDYQELGRADTHREVVYNSIDLDRFSPTGDAADLDGRSGMDPAAEGVLRIGLIATFAKWKGHIPFLHAVAKLPRDLPFRAYIIGDAIYQRSDSQHTRAELEALAGRLGVRDRLGITGFIDDVAQAIRSLDIVVHASTEPEPFGMVIAEGMACQRAVIASRAGGALEIIEEGVTALAHTPGDADELALSLEKLMRDAGLRRKLAMAGREVVLRRFNRQRLGKQLTELYEQLAGSTNGKGEGEEKRTGGAQVSALRV